MIRLIVVCLLLSMSAAVAEERGWASVDDGKPTPYDGANYHGKLSTGARFNPFSMTAAHRTLPFGTLVQVDYPKGSVAYVKINDCGPCCSAHCHRVSPWILKRIIDLTPEAADRIILPGLGQVVLRVCRVYMTNFGFPIRACT